MQKLLLIPFLWGAVYAQDLTPTQMMKLTKPKSGLLAKIKYQRLLKRTAKIEKDQAKAIAQKACGAEVSLVKLKKHSRRLFYRINIAKCSLKVDALDGSIMSKEEC